jgi:hypothetical protein
MKYLCLCYYDPDKFDALSEPDLAAVGRGRTLAGAWRPSPAAKGEGRGGSASWGPTRVHR